MAVNKVIYDGRTLIDTSNVTVTAETLAEGETALNAAGEEIVGTMADRYDEGLADGAKKVKTEEARTSDDLFTDYDNYAVTIPSGYYAEGIVYGVDGIYDAGYDEGLAVGGGGIPLQQYLFDLTTTVHSDSVTICAFNYNTAYYLHLYVTVALHWGDEDSVFDVWEAEAVIEPDGEWCWNSAENGYSVEAPNFCCTIYVTDIVYTENGEI